MNRFIYLFIVGLFICVNIAHSNSNTQTNHADSSITTPKHNYYQAFRDERFKSQNKPYDYNRMIGYNLLMSPGRIRNYYIVDTLHIPYYYILKDSTDYTYLITNKKVIENGFDYKNPLKNKGCYLTDNGDLIEGCGSISNYFDGIILHSFEIAWPYKPKVIEKLPHGFTLCEPFDMSEKGEEQWIHEYFAVILIKGNLYNKLSNFHKNDYHFLDKDAYYILLSPFYPEIYEHYFNKLINNVN